MMSNDLLISIVAPAYNEEDCISEFVKQTLNVIKKYYENYELIIIDDGSTDQTNSKIKEIQKKEKNIRLVQLSRNYGREIAITAGLENSIGDIVVVMDSDLQDPPEFIPQFITKLIETNCDVVYGEIISVENPKHLQTFITKVFYNVSSWMTGLHLPENATDFRVMNRKVINSIIKVKEKIRFMKMLYAFVGFNMLPMPVARKARYSGKSKKNIFKLANLAIDGMVSFSSAPLRFVTWVSLISSFTLLIILIVSFFKVNPLLSTNENVEYLFPLTSITFSIIFLFFAIFSEYLSRILTESKIRPLYYIKEEFNSPILHQNLNIAEDL